VPVQLPYTGGTPTTPNQTSVVSDGVQIPYTGIEVTDAIPAPYTSGTQPVDLSLKEDKANKGQANGYAPLDANSKVPTANLPDQASLDAEVDGKISTHNSATTSVHGIANTSELIHSNAVSPNTDKIVTFNQSTPNGSDSEIGAWGFGVEESSGTGNEAYIDTIGLHVQKRVETGDTNHIASVVIEGDKITFSPNSGNINLSGNPYTSTPNYVSTGGSIDLSATNGDGCNGGNIISRGGTGSSSIGGTLNMSGGDDAEGGSINTSGSSATQNSDGGSINTSGGLNGSGGSINTSNNGGSIDLSNGGGSIISHAGAMGNGTDGGGGGSISLVGGSGGNPGDDGGHGGSAGSINLNGGYGLDHYGGSGGSIILQGTSQEGDAGSP